MARDSQFPPLLLIRATILSFRGRIHFQKDIIGGIEKGAGEDFEVFRKVTVDPAGNQPASPGAMLSVQFLFSRYSDRTNRFLSRIPIAFIVAQPGFRSKTWMSGRETGAFHGVYEWDSVDDAEKYCDSFPLRLMRKRAVPETLSIEITKV